MLVNLKNRIYAISELKITERFLSNLIENAGSVTYVKMLDGNYVRVNKTWEEVLFSGNHQKHFISVKFPAYNSKGLADAEVFHLNIRMFPVIVDEDVIGSAIFSRNPNKQILAIEERDAHFDTIEKQNQILN
jgi:hypothetical protein